MRKFKIPQKVAVFPLPNVVLFPKVELPLFIFEPRYRKMLADIIRGNKLLAISLVRKGGEKKKKSHPSYEIAGLGLAKAAIQNDDGTSHILLKGLERVRITRYVQMKPYPVARVRPVPDEVEDALELSKLSQTLRNLFIQRIRLASDEPAQEVILPKELKDPITLSHYASFIVSASPHLKQDILETTSVNCRMKHLISLLEEEIHPSGSQN